MILTRDDSTITRFSRGVKNRNAPCREESAFPDGESKKGGGGLAKIQAGAVSIGRRLWLCTWLRSTSLPASNSTRFVSPQIRQTSTRLGGVRGEPATELAGSAGQWRINMKSPLSAA